MRRIAAVLVLLSATVARAGVGDGDGMQVIFHGLICCAPVPFVLLFSLAITLAIYDWRKARRPTPPGGDD